MNTKTFFLFLFCLIGVAGTQSSFAQHHFTGRLFDAHNRQPVEGALVIAGTSTAVSDSQGVISFSHLDNNTSLQISHINYYPQQLALTYPWADTLMIHLQPSSHTLEAIQVEGKVPLPEQKAVSTVSLNIQSLQERPQSFGEVDIIRVLQNKAGIARTSELDGSMYVRGSLQAHNQIRLDGGTLFNASHMLGLYSSFNGSALGKAELEKGGFHPRYGGKLASYLDVQTRSGDKEKYKAEAGIGILSSRLLVEGPIMREKSSFLFAARRSYFDVITNTYNKVYEKEEGFSALPQYGFYDLNGKLSFDLSPAHELSIEGFYSQDGFQLDKEKNFNTQIEWGNRNVTANWTYDPDGRWLLKAHSGLSQYTFRMGLEKNKKVRSANTTRSWQNQVEAAYQLSDYLKLESGLFMHFNSYDVLTEGSTNDFITVYKESKLDQTALYTGFFFNGKWNFNDVLEIHTGARLNYFSQQQTSFKDLVPRFSLTYQPYSHWLLHLNYSQTRQYEHVSSLLSFSLPADLHFPSNEMIRPEKATQVSGGISYQGAAAFVHVGGYYKWMNQLPDYRNGTDLAFDDINEQIVNGKGASSGLESEFKWETEGFSLQANYTFGFNWLEFEEINKGLRFHPGQDIRHSLSLNGFVKINKNLSVTANWFYNSGFVSTLPNGLMPYQGAGSHVSEPQLVPLTDFRNNFRMPATHRLDLAVNYNWQSRHNRHSTLTVGLYNAYNQSNAYFIYYRLVKEEETSRLEARKKALLPLIPTISYRFKLSSK